ncbi:MAG: hypothetical protein ACTSUP_09635 [Candidatus Heimdallarchaeaceae archaeon]
MFKKLRKSKRAISEVLAVVIIISLVIGASAIVGVILLNVDVADLPWDTDTVTAKDVHLTLALISSEDTDLDTLFDKISIYLSLDVDSPTIYINDIDLILPTGYTIDKTNPWIIIDTLQTWNGEFSGFTVPYGSINASFDIQASDLSINDGELEDGASIYIIVNYTYISDLGARIQTLTSFYQSELLTIT